MTIASVTALKSLWTPGAWVLRLRNPFAVIASWCSGKSRKPLSRSERKQQRKDLVRRSVKRH